MSSTASVSTWISQVKAGDREAAQKLFERYITQLVRLARDKLPAGRRRADDEEDVALSAMDSFLRAAERGRFPNLHGRDSLWALLVTITVRKAWKVARREKRRPEVGESALPGGWRQILECEPPPDVVFHTLERCRVLLNQLSPELRSVALRKMEGFTNAEIAGFLGRSEGAVERKLRAIRKIWEKEIAP